jgi:hypothetical protein
MTHRARLPVCFMLLGLSAAAGQAQPPPKPPELKVLERFVGAWDFGVISMKAEWTPKQSSSTGTSANEWTLDGRALRRRVRHPDLETIEMMTYDAGKKAYRYWIFDSRGAATELTGQWDEKTRTLTFTGARDENITVVATMRFFDKNVHEGSYIAKDKTGKTYVEAYSKFVKRD